MHLQGPGAETAVPAERRGRYLGVLDRLPELQELGVTAVVLGPVSQCGPGMGPWGRNPLAFFAPDTKLASGGPLTAAAELKTVRITDE